MALAIDASTPALTTQTTTSIATVASNSFTPPDNSIVVIAWVCDASSLPSAPSITDSLGSHLTWNLIQWKSAATAPAAPGQAAMWWASVATSAAMTVTVTSGSISGERAAAIKPWVLTGADTTQVGTNGKNARNASAGTTIAETYTAAQTAGWGFIVDCDFAGAGTQTAGTGMTSDGSGSVLTNISYGFMRRTTADDIASSGTTLNVTTPSTTTISWVWAEAVPAPPSGPAVIDEAVPTYQWTPGLGPWGPDQFVQDTYTSVPDTSAPPPYQAAWWRSDTLALTNGAAVASWTDSSGNGQTLAQGTGAAQPTYVTNVVNGWPVVRFDGTTDFLDATITSQAQPNTWFVVLKPSSTAALMNVTSGGEEIIVDAGGLVELWGGASSISNITASTSSWLLLGAQINNASSAVWSDNAAGTIGTLGTAATGTALRVGNHSSLSRFFNGDIAEIILYNRVLTTDERAQVFGYLHAKYLSGAAPSTSAPAELTTAAATGYDASIAATVNAETTTGAATAFDATVQTGISVPAETTTGSATGYDASIAAAGNAEQTTTAGTAYDAAASAAVNAETTTPAATAYDATIATGQSANAEQTTAAATGFDATAAAGPAAGNAAAAATAYDATASPGVNAEQTGATASAFDATVLTGVQTAAEQTTAAATGLDAAVAAGPNADVAATTATAYDAAAAVAVPAGNATAAATAYDATVSTLTAVSAPAEQTTAAATAYDAATAVAVPAEQAAATATGLDATAAAGAPAGNATAAATAFDATITLGQLASAAAATASAAAFDAAAAAAAGTELASVSAAAFDATVVAVSATVPFGLLEGGATVVSATVGGSATTGSGSADVGQLGVSGTVS